MLSIHAPRLKLWTGADGLKYVDIPTASLSLMRDYFYRNRTTRVAVVLRVRLPVDLIVPHLTKQRAVGQ